MSASPRTPNPPHRLDLVALALTPWMILAQGHRFGVGNHDTLLSFIRRINNPTYIVNDWMLGTPPVHPQVLGLMAAMVTRLGEPVAFLVAHVGTRLLLLMGVWRLAMALVAGRVWVAVAAMVMVFFEPRLQVGAHYLQGGHWEPAFLGMAFAVWMVALGTEFLQGRAHWITVAIFSGLGIFSHLFICGPVFFCFCVAVVLTRNWSSDFWKMAAAVLFIGSPSWASAAWGFFFPGNSPLSGQEVIQLLQFRHPHHHQPWTWPVPDIIQQMIVVGSGFWVLRRREGSRPAWIFAAVLLVYFLITCMLFWVLGRLQMVPILAYLQPFRLGSLLMLMGGVGLLGVVAEFLRERGWKDHWILAIALPVFVAARAGLPALAGLVIILLRGGEEREERPPKFPVMLLRFIAALGVVGIIVVQSSDFVRDAANGIRRNYWLHRVAVAERSREELAAWVQFNTNPDSLFAIPPQMERFRILERRAILVDFKNVPYRNEDLRDWAQRVKLVTGIDPYERFTSVPSGDPPIAQLLQAANTLNADYVVVRDRVDHPLMTFRNEEFTVLDLSLQEDRQVPWIPPVPAAPRGSGGPVSVPRR